MSGYPRLDESGRFRRTPYEDRALYNLGRAGDPYATRPRDTLGRESLERKRFGSRHHPEGFGPPLITVSNPYQQQPQPGQSGPYASFARMSETPPPRPSRYRIDGFQDVFGGYERPGKIHTYTYLLFTRFLLTHFPDRGYNDRLNNGPMGPRNPYSGPWYREQHPRRALDPYGGLGEPRNPFAPGGVGYATRWRTGPPGDPERGFGDEERRRREYHRSQVGEPWGVAQYNAYEVSAASMKSVWHRD